MLRTKISKMSWIHSTHPLWRFAEVVGYVVILSLVFDFLGFQGPGLLALGTVILLKALSWARSRTTAKKSDSITG